MSLNFSNIKSRILDQSTLVTAFMQDINDTITNANNVISAQTEVLDLEGMTVQNAINAAQNIPTPIRVCTTEDGIAIQNGGQSVYYIYIDSTQLPVIGQYDSNSGQLIKVDDIYRVVDETLELQHEISELTAEYSGEAKSTIGGLLHSASDALGQATILGRLTDLIASGRDDVLTPFVSIAGSQIDRATDGTKMMYESIVDQLSKVQGSKIAAFGVLKSIYESLANIVTGSTGEYYTFDDTDYKVQGFAAGNLVQAVISSAATIAGAIVATAAPILGMAIMMVPQLVGNISSAVTDIMNNNEASWNADACNTLFNVPFWQGEIADDDLTFTYIGPDGNYIWLSDQLDRYGVATVSIPGAWLAFWKSSNPGYLKCEAYFNCTINPVVVSGHHITQTFSGFAGSGVPMDLDNGSDYLSFGLVTTKENWSILDYPEEIRRINGLDTVQLDAAAQLAVIAAMTTVIRMGASVHYGYNVPLQDIPVGICHATMDYINDWHNHGTWDKIVNDIIYRGFRSFTAADFKNFVLKPYMRDFNPADTGITISLKDPQGSYFDVQSRRDLMAVFSGAPTRGNFFIVAPTYGKNALFNTIMIAIGITAATTAVAIAAAVVRTKVRNSQIRSYAKVSKAAQRLAANPTDPSLEKAYIKAAKSYNMKSSLLGYSSRVNMIDGWQEAKSTNTVSDVSVSGLYSNASSIKNTYDEVLNRATGQDIVNNNDTLANLVISGFPATASPDQLTTAQQAIENFTHNEISTGLAGSERNITQFVSDAVSQQTIDINVLLGDIESSIQSLTDKVLIIKNLIK